MPSTVIGLVTICASFVLGAAVSTSAYTTTPSDCAAAKRSAVGKQVESALRCWSVAAKRQAPVDPLCLARGEAKFLIAFGRAERGEGCLTLGDAEALGAAVDAYVAAVVAALPDSGPPVPTPTNTAAGQPTATKTATPTATSTPTAPPKVVFVVATLVDAAFAGLAGADAICAQHAAGVGLPGVFKAWLSAGGPGNSAAERLTHSSVPYVLPESGAVVANDWNDLTDGTLDIPIAVGESGLPVALPFVFTATNADGTYAGTDCGGWNDPAAGNVITGGIGFSDAQWTHQAQIYSCSGSGTLYCFEQ